MGINGRDAAPLPSRPKEACRVYLVRSAGPMPHKKTTNLIDQLRVAQSR